MGGAAARVKRTLDGAGYSDQRWYPIGVGHLHGFAVTTRLEQIDDHGTPKLGLERWSPLYPESANLLWLLRAREPRLPGPGRYRAFLVAFTDLPVDPSLRRRCGTRRH
jgi:hypothetical protein